MMNTKAHEAGFRFTGYHMIACMIAFFGVIIAVNTMLAVLASSSWTGLVVKNSYVASQKFNAELKAAKVQHDAGWRSELTYTKGIIQVHLIDKNGKPVALDKAHIFIGRPAFEQQDQDVALTENSHGKYYRAVKLTEGYWDIQVKGLVNGQPYRRDARLLVNGDLSGILE